MDPGDYQFTALDTDNGHILADETRNFRTPLRLRLPPFRHDLALAVRRVDLASSPAGP